MKTEASKRRQCALFLFACGVAIAGSAEESAAPPAKDLPLPGEVFFIDDHAAFLIAPTAGESDGPIPWVFYAPTLPGLPGKEETWMFERLLAAGIAIAGIDVGESYGSPDGRALYSALHQKLAEERGLSEKACLLARSRGGLMLYNWAAENPDKAACIAAIYPVCNLLSYPGVDKASAAYNMDAAALQAQLAQHNPIDRLEGLAKADVPIFHIHGDVDEVVPLEENSGLVAERYRKLGGTITLIVPEGQGHNMWEGFFQCQELVDFVIEHADRRQPRKE